MGIQSKRVRVYEHGESTRRRNDLGKIVAYDITIKKGHWRKRRAFIPRNLTSEERSEWRLAKREIIHFKKNKKNERGFGWESRVYSMGPLAVKVFTARNIGRMLRKNMGSSMNIETLRFSEPHPYLDRLRWLFKSITGNNEIKIAKEHLRMHTRLTEAEIPAIKLIGALEREGIFFTLLKTRRPKRRRNITRGSLERLTPFFKTYKIKLFMQESPLKFIPEMFL